jgi:hypothetical protein
MHPSLFLKIPVADPTDLNIESVWVALWWSPDFDLCIVPLLALLIDKMTESEIAHESRIPDVLETISQLMEQLAVLDVLPDDLDQSDFVCNRALDVRSASLVYLAVCIRHHSIRGGIPGIRYSIYCC